MNSFHFSVDDVLPSLIDVTDRQIPLIENNFFAQLRYIYEKYGVKTGLNLFYAHRVGGEIRYLTEVRDLKEEMKDGWIYFAPHALDFHTPPYAQDVEDQIQTLDKIMHEIERIAGNYKASSVRFHYYSECYEIAKNILNYGMTEMFVTDKLVGSHRLPQSHVENLLSKGFTDHNGLKVTRTNFRVENLANDKASQQEIIESFTTALEKYSRIVIYSHEYEHDRKDVSDMLIKSMDILVTKLGLRGEIP